MKTSASRKSLDDALLESVKAGDVGRVRDSLSAGADIHAQEDRALRWAAERGYLEMVRLLLDSGADLHADRNRALRKSVANDRLDATMLLVDHGADLEVGIACAWVAGKDEILHLLSKVKRAREERWELSIEVPEPEQADRRIRM